MKIGGKIAFGIVRSDKAATVQCGFLPTAGEILETKTARYKITSVQEVDDQYELFLKKL